MAETKEELKESAKVEAPLQPEGASTSETNEGDRRTTGSVPPRTRVHHPLVELTLGRIREFLREPEVIFWVFAFPILLVCALGIAFRNTGPEKVHIAVERTGADDAASKALFDALSRSTDVEPLLLSSEEATQALRSGKVALVVQPKSVGAKAETDNSGQQNNQLSNFDYRFDPTRPESRQARLVADDALQRAAGRSDVVRAGEQTFTEPGARYIDFLIPGLLGMNLMGSGMWGLGFTIVNSRMRKLLKRFAATPMRRFHYLFSFVLSRLIFLVLEVAVVIVFAWFAFGYVVRGSFLEMSFLLLLGAMTFSGIGLLVAARPRTIEGVSGLMNLVMMPMWLLSGTFFSSERFPEVIQPFIKALPLTALNDSLRGVMNDGASISTHWVAICVLLAWGVISFMLALKTFRWQ
jgi:ABC-type multidrug transport system permease subunit